MQARYITASLLIKTTGSVNPWADQRLVQALLSEFSGPPPLPVIYRSFVLRKSKKSTESCFAHFFNIIVYTYHHFWLRQSKTKTRGAKEILTGTEVREIQRIYSEGFP